MNYSEIRMKNEIKNFKNGIYSFKDTIENDGIENKEYDVSVDVYVSNQNLVADFRKSSNQAKGPINAPNPQKTPNDAMAVESFLPLNHLPTNIIETVYIPAKNPHQRNKVAHKIKGIVVTKGQTVALVRPTRAQIINTLRGLK